MNPLMLLGLLPALAWGSPDTEIWSSAEVGWEASDAVEIGVAQHLRLDPAPGRAEALTDFGVGLAPAKSLDLGASYRTGLVDLGDEAEARHRVALDATVPLRVDDLRLSLRERYQVQLGTGQGDARHVLRTRLAAKWKGDLPFVPYAQVEPHLELGEDGPRLSKWRATTGAQIPVGKTELDLFYRVDLPVAAVDDPSTHIVGLSVSWHIERQK